LLDQIPQLQKQIYTIEFKIKNKGDVEEQAKPQGEILDFLNNSVFSWSHSETTLNPNEYKYRSKDINFSTFSNGRYEIRPYIDLIGEVDINPENNFGSRYVDVIPEPLTISLLCLPAGYIMFKKRRR